MFIRYSFLALLLVGCGARRDDNFDGDSDSNSASSSSDESSNNETHTDETDEGNTNSWTDACGEEACLRIVPGMKVCRLMGRFNQTVTDFSIAIHSQSEVYFEPGVFPIDAVPIRGTLRTGTVQTDFWSETPVQAQIGSAGSGEVLLTTHDPPIPVISDAGPFEVSFTLAPVRDGTNRHFTLDNFDELDPDIDAKEVFVFNYPLLGEPIMLTRFDSCDMVGTPDDLFRFTFENGDSLDVTIRSRLHKTGIRVQAGVVRRVVGEIDDLKIDISDRFKIFHSARHHSDELVVPSVIALFDEHNGHCGIVLRARLGDPTYEAFYLDCAYQKSDPLNLVAVDYPGHYRESWDQ